MKRAIQLIMMMGVMVLLLTACSLTDFLFEPVAATPETGGDEAMPEIGLMLSVTVPAASPTTMPTMLVVNTLAVDSTSTPVMSPTVAPLLVVSEAPAGSAEPNGPAAVNITATTAAPTRTALIALTVTPNQSGSAATTEATSTGILISSTPEATKSGTLASPTPKATTNGATVATRTSTPSASKTPIPVNVYDPRVSRGEPDWSDPMDDGNNWPGGADSYTDIYFENSKMALVGVSEAVGWRVAKTEVFRDFYADLLVSSGECAAGDAYGLIFRVPDLETPNQGYLFVVNCEGAYTLKRWNGNVGRGLWATLINWKYTDALYNGPNQTNRLGVRADGRSLSLYINGKWINNIYDATYDDGYIGVFVNRYKTERYTIQVDELNVWRNP